MTHHDPPDGPRRIRPIPSSVLYTHPDVPARDWWWASPLRLMAPHPARPGMVWVVAVSDMDGTQLASRPVVAEIDQIHRAYAELRTALMRIVGHQIACQDGTPVTRINRRCVYCGRPAGDHTTIDEHANLIVGLAALRHRQAPVDPGCI